MGEETSDIVANLMRLAQKFQRENGGFLPFGEVCEDGERTYQAAEDETAGEIIGSLNQVYRAKVLHGAVEWATLCFDVRVTDIEAYPEGTDAIQVDYEDRNGQSLTYFVPYQERTNGTFEYQPSFIRSKDPRWFA